jgi:hypothetical protein
LILAVLVAAAIHAIGKALGEGRMLRAVRVRVVVMLGTASVASNMGHVVVSLLLVHRMVGWLVVI